MLPSLTLSEVNTLPRLNSEVEKLPQRLGNDISLEINSEQDKERMNDSPSLGLGLSLLTALFSVASQLSSNKRSQISTKF